MQSARALSRHFQFAAASLPGWPDAAIPRAAIRAGALGVLDLEYAPDQHAAQQALARLRESADARWGVRVDPLANGFLDEILAATADGLQVVILTGAPREALQKQIDELRHCTAAIWLQVSCIEEARVGLELGVDALLAKGHEAAGRVQDETTFVLLQRLLREIPLPIWAEGGVGVHTAAACYAAGAAGVILSSQLMLTRESPLTSAVRESIARFDGSETILLGEDLEDAHRVYAKARLPVIEQLQDFARGLIGGGSDETTRGKWRAAIRERVGWGSPEEQLWLLGQDAAFARDFAERFRTVGGAIAGLRESISRHVEAARRVRPLAEDSPLARSIGTRYPIAQGPMTRVSDRATFAGDVADGGGLPFLALSLLRADELQTLFAETRDLLKDRPWGVGILGFVPLELRQEQLEVIRKFRPPFALIAGGRPDQARSLERDGIPTFLHVPSPSLLKLFLEAGTRRFVFEGRECGGHVGPRTSFVLWELMIDVLLDSLSDEQLAECHILFAGGVHDALSASMIACLGAPLAERGAKIGVLMGTAYTMTEEAVSSGAIVRGFQEEALRCSRTRLLETGPGHATRCADTQFARTFVDEKRNLIAAGKAAEEIRDSLEELNLGRLRVATKGIDRNAAYRQDPSAPKLIKVDEPQQHAGGMYMIGQVAALRDRVCTIAELHHDVCTGGTQRVERIDTHTTLEAADHTRTPIEVAIIGMSCILPKATDLQTYWENILGEVYAISEVPPSRWDADLYFDSDRNAPDKTYSKWGGFIDPVEFNPLDFGMPPNSLPSIDTLQLLALKAARDAMADAGYATRPFDRAATSVILGASGGLGDLGTGYSVRSTLPHILGDQGEAAIASAGDRLPTWTEDSFAGLLPNVAAGRISNRLDLGGLNFVVDAACASSLAAVNLAVNELQCGNSNMVLVGGIDTIQSPFGFMCFAKTQALSPNGRPRTFDKDADGIAIGEGVVMLVLKRLADAERDGDRVYAVIRGTAGSSDGKAMGLTAPRIEGQKQALRRAYAKAGISPSSIGHFEAHGTGTVVGDRTEAVALAEYLEQAGVEGRSTAIGSVKSMIGHTKATAGVAGMAKMALALHHKVLPATLGVTTPNAEARLQDGPLYVNAQTRPWLATPRRPLRRAGVSSFGFGGTNFHAILEEYEGDQSADSLAVARRWPTELLRWSATSREELAQQLQQLGAALQQGAQPALPDLAAMLERSAKAGGQVRLAIIAGSLEELHTRVELAVQQIAREDLSDLQDPRGIYFSCVAADPQAKLAFLFPGQGSQFPDMLKDLAIHLSEVRQAFERADRNLADRFPEGLSRFIFPPPRFNEEQEKQAREALAQTDIAQPALGAAGVAMLQVLQSLGLNADMTAGHSYGEYVALFAGGAIDETTLHRLSEARGRFIVESAGGDLGTMAAVTAGPGEVSTAIEGITDLWIANLNSPQQTIISGSTAAIEVAVRKLEERGRRCKRFPVSCAFHSPLVAAAKEKLAEFLQSCTFRPPRIDVYSNTTAQPHPQDGAAIAGQLSEHLVRPVRFVEEIEAMYAAGARTFVEVGPGNVLTNLAKRILGDRPHLALATDAAGRDGRTQLQHCLAQLIVQGVPVQAERLLQGRVGRTLALETLVAATRPAEPAPTTWLVDGGKARPLREQPVSTPSRAGKVVESSPAAGVPPKTVAAAPADGTPSTKSDSKPPNPPAPSAPRSQVVLTTPSSPAMSTPPERPDSSPIVPAAAAADPSMAVMLQYQELMTRFLETQQQVMLGYLGGTVDLVNAPSPAMARIAPPVAAAQLTPAVSAPPAPPVASAAREAAAPPVRSSDPSATTSAPSQDDVSRTPAAGGERAAVGPLETPVPVAASVSAEQLTHRLLELVSDRTGYPTEMLDLDLDIEAELGIDSIKRVEILAMLQNSCMPEGWESGESDMEELLKFRTMRGIVDWMAAQAAAVATPATSTADSQAIQKQQPEMNASAPAATGVGQEQVTRQLLELVSDRTGYPTEMLDLDLDIEAELGIDSIKRVEILAMLQNNCMPAGWEQGESDMEELLKFRTMRGIVEWMVARAPAAATAATPGAIPPSEEIFVPTASAAEPLTHNRLSEQLRQLVSERTGYPTEMLDLDLDIEAELGIDSIKRVEILAMLQNNCVAEGWDAGEAAMEELLKFRTMRGIVDWMAQAAIVSTNGSAAHSATSNGELPHKASASGNGVVKGHAPRTADASAAAEVVQAVPRFSYTMIDAPSEVRELPRARGAILVTDDETDVADAVLARLSEEGVRGVRIRCGAGCRQDAADAWTLDVADSGAVQQLADRFRQGDIDVAGIVHLLPLRTETRFEDLDVDGWDRCNRQQVKGLFHLARAFAADIRQAGEGGAAWVIAVTKLGGGLGSNADAQTALLPSHGGIAGLIKTLALEWTSTHCKLVDLDDATAGNPSLVATVLLDEMAQQPRREEVEVGYVDGERMAPRVVRLPLEARPEAGVTIDRESVILITGGARGITATIACDLARRYQPTIILAGRSGEPEGVESAETASLTSPQELKGALIERFRREGRTATPKEIEAAYNRLLNEREMRQNLARMRELGARVHYHQVDVRDEAAFGGLLEAIYETHGRVDGVIHGAGVIEDKLLEQKSDDSFDRVFETKTRSAFTLSRKLRPDSLKFLVFFSSMAGRFGNRGQSDYAAANEVLNKLAIVLDRKWPARVVAINWGPWQTGMVSPEVQRQFAQRGVQLIPPADGARVLDEELRKGTGGEVEIVLGDGPWKHLIAETAPSAAPGTLPLIVDPPRVVSGGAVEIIRTLNLHEDLYLSDHELDGKPVLPLAMAMELAAELVQEAWPELTFVGLNTMTMLNGIILTGESRQVRVVARPQTDPSHESLDLEVSVEIGTVDGDGRPSYRGTVLLSERFPAPPDIDLAGFSNLQPLPLSVEECYERWLFHGPCFQGITAVPGLNRHGIVADITPSLPDECLASGPGGRWLLDPVTIDCGFQLGILWERVHYDMTPLPARIDRVRRYGELGGGPVRTYFVARPDVQGRILNCDIHFFDGAGRLLASVENLQTACSKELNRLAERGVSPA